MRRLHTEKIDTPKYYERIWAEECNLRAYYDEVRQHALAARVKAGDRVADLGAGCFGTAQYLLERTGLAAKIEAWAIDYSHTAQGLIRRRLDDFPKFNYVLSPAEITPFRDGYFDVVIAGELIEHYERPEELAAEMARIAKPGGWIVLSTVDDGCQNAIRHGEYPEHLWGFDDGDLARLFSAYGAAREFLCGDYRMVECRRAA